MYIIGLMPSLHFCSPFVGNEDVLKLVKYSRITKENNSVSIYIMVLLAVILNLFLQNTLYHTIQKYVIPLKFYTVL